MKQQPQRRRRRAPKREEVSTTHVRKGIFFLMILLGVVSFCAVALAELFVLGAFAANFAGYSNGYLSGADLANLFVPGLGASWEQEVYAGLGTTAAVVLALAGLLVQRKKAAEFFRRHTHIVVAAVVLLVLDAALTGGMEYPALSDQLDQALSGTELTGLSEQELADRVAGKLAEELLASRWQALWAVCWTAA